MSATPPCPARSASAATAPRRRGRQHVLHHLPQDDGALRHLVAAELGAAAVPETFTQIDAVPIGPTGKPDRRALLARRQA